jgi:arylformamidase
VTDSKVFLDYDQAGLDAAYDQNIHSPNRPLVLDRYASASEATRARLGAPARHAYGATEAERLDLFATTQPHAPVQIFVHGGAWRGGFAKNYAFLADFFVAAGAHYIALDFAAAPDVGGDLSAIADQLRRAVVWVARNARTFGGDPARIYVTGHSSGAHGAAVLLTTDWQRDFGLPADVIKGGLCASGMYDLKPVRLSSRNSYLSIDDRIEEALSPQRHVGLIHAPLIVACGALESPEFLRHARDFAGAVAASGKPVTSVVGAGYNHFEILETLANPLGLLGRAALAQMGLQWGGREPAAARLPAGAMAARQSID